MIYLFFIILSYVIYFHTLHYSFYIYDDAENISLNIHHGLNLLESINWYWFNSLTPIPHTFWLTISKIWGNNDPAPYRFLNIFIHGINGALLYQFMKILFLKFASFLSKSEIKNFSFLSSLIFVIHPVATESVIWVSSFRSLLAATFLLLYLLQISKDEETNYVLAILYFIASILTNPIFTGVFFISFFFSKKPLKIEFVILLLLIGFFFYLHSTNIIQKKYFSFVTTSEHLALFNKSLYEYIKIALLPFDLKVISHLNLTTIQNNNIYQHLGFISFSSIIISLPFLLQKTKKYHTLFKILFSFFILAQITNMGLFLHDYSALSVTASRYAYFSSSLIWLVYSIVLSIYIPKYWKQITTVITIALFALQLNQSCKWSSSANLLEESYASNPDSIENLIALGQSMTLEKNYDGAEKIFTQALIRKPPSNEALSNLLKLIISTRDYQHGYEIIKKSNLDLNNFHPELYFDIAKLYCHNGQFKEASYFITKYTEFNQTNLEAVNFLKFLNESKCI